MKRHLRIATDIKPVSDFRANAAGIIDQVKTSGRPPIEEIELLSDVRTSMKQIDDGLGVSNRDAKAELRKRLAR